MPTNHQLHHLAYSQLIHFMLENLKLILSLCTSLAISNTSYIFLVLQTTFVITSEPLHVALHSVVTPTVVL